MNAVFCKKKKVWFVLAVEQTLQDRMQSHGVVLELE